MSTKTLEDLKRGSEALTPDEKARLAAYLLEETAGVAPPAAGRKWQDLAGMVAHPLFGEDAQDYVSRTRQEADRHASEAEGD